jgi:hypothetical protein
MVNLTSKISQPVDKEDFSNYLNGTNNFTLNLSGFNFDSFFMLYSFLSDKF